MSFNPEVGHWFARHAPQRLRGLVVTEAGQEVARAGSARHLALWRARPDFLAYDIRDLPSRFAAAQRREGHAGADLDVPQRSTDRARAAEHADQIIYESAPR